MSEADWIRKTRQIIAITDVGIRVKAGFPLFVRCPWWPCLKLHYSFLLRKSCSGELWTDTSRKTGSLNPVLWTARPQYPLLKWTAWSSHRPSQLSFFPIKDLTWTTTGRRCNCHRGGTGIGGWLVEAMDYTIELEPHPWHTTLLLFSLAWATWK